MPVKLPTARDRHPAYRDTAVFDGLAMRSWIHLYCSHLNESTSHLNKPTPSA